MVRRLKIDTVTLDLPIEAQALDGRTLTRSSTVPYTHAVEYRTVPVNLLVSGNHHESISLLVITSPFSPVVLVTPGLKPTTPRLIGERDESCLGVCTVCPSVCGPLNLLGHLSSSPWPLGLGGITVIPYTAGV